MGQGSPSRQGRVVESQVHGGNQTCKAGRTCKPRGRSSPPGGGAFPFWLSLGMLLCCLWIIVRWVTRTSPPSRSTEVYMTPQTVRWFLLVAGSLAVMIGLIHIIGVYGAVPLFLIFYIRFLGRHSWKIAVAMAIGTPVAAFFFFEIALKKTLPKGFTEPLFYPLYDIFL